MKKSRANKGQFSVIAALLVSVILVTAVISAYTLVRHAPIQDSPKVLTAIGEMNADIKQILDFTVGYYGSILKVTGNSTYARNLTTTYLSSGLVSIARSHPEWNPSFSLTFSSFSTSWFMPESFSVGNLSVAYSLESLGIDGVQYETSSALEVTMLESDSGVARIRVTRDNSEPELGLTKDNFCFYNYTEDSTWELINPPSILISSNGVYNITLPSGIDADTYSVQVEDSRGLMVSAFYSPNSVASASKIPRYTYTFDWNATGMIDIFEALSTDSFTIELLQNGTLRWLGKPLEVLPKTNPIPPICIKAFHVNATVNDVSREVPFQIEDWASDYMVPLGLSSNESIFSSINMFVFLANNEISEITLWWDGNDTAIQTPYAWTNVYFTDDVTNPDNAQLSNGYLDLTVRIAGSPPQFEVTSNVGGSTSTADFLRINGKTPVFWADTSYIIYNGIVRDIIQQEPEYSGGVTSPNCPNFYTQIVLTLPANATYYTYSLRTIFVDSVQSRTITDLSAIQLSGLSGDPLTEDGTSGGYPDTSDADVSFSDGSPSGWDHHWSQFSSFGSGAGVMFTNSSNEDLYVFDDVIGVETGALVVEDEFANKYIEVNPVELQQVTPFFSARDLTWYGAVVTFNAEPIHPDSGHDGLWVMVEHPPVVSMDEYEEEEEEEPPPPPPESPLEFFVVSDTSDVDSSPDKGSHSNFAAQKAGPDSTVDLLTEATEGSDNAIEDYVDNDTSDVDGSEDVGSHSSFVAQQVGPDSTFDTLTEENTAGSGESTLLDDGFEGSPWNDNWDDVSSTWRSDNYPVHGGGTSAWAPEYCYDDFISDNLDTSDASAIFVDFWFRKDDTESTDFTLYYYDGNQYDLIDELDDNGWDDNWLHFTATVTDSQYFISNFRIRFDATLGNNENVWVDDVLITKEVSTGDSYELDLEVQFTGVVDFLPNNELCIYTGSLGSEDLNVAYWNGYAWENVATDLTENSWNNFTVSLSSATFTVRFSGGNDVGDASVDQWQIDTVLLNSRGSGSAEEAVDNDTSDVDSSSDLGTITNFANMQTADYTYTTLSESGSGAGISFVNFADSSYYGTSTQINKPAGTQADDFMIALLVSTSWSPSTISIAPSGWTLEHEYTTSSGNQVYVYWKIAGASEPTSYTWTWASWCGWSAQINTFRGVDTSSPIHMLGSVNQETSNSPTSPSITTTEDNCMIWLYDLADGAAVPYGDGGAPSGTTWIDQTQMWVGISTAYFTQASAGATGNKDWTLTYYEDNAAQQFALKPASTTCRLDQEIQWTNIPCTMPNEYLSIYGGNMGAEDVAVDVWTGSGWETIFTDLSSGWNNASITGWLTDSTFTIRFRDGTEVGDSSPDTWQIDVALIHMWSEGDDNYELDLEVQWTGVEFDKANEELCIYVDEVGSENLGVEVWTGSSWASLTTLHVGWNNVTVHSYLTSSTFTIRFVGTTETGDTAQDYWAIDATLLRCWD